MTVEQQVLSALRFYATGRFQGMVASDDHIARDQAIVSIAVRAVSLAIVLCLGIRRGWIDFLQTTGERDDVERGFQRLGRIPGVIGCVDGTMIAIVGPSQNDPTVTKAAYWCRKQYYALNVMVVWNADCRVMSIDPRYPGSVHDSFAWRYSWLRSNFEQGRLIDDGRLLLGDNGYAVEPWLITPVPGFHATSTACGRFNKAHSSMSSEPAVAVPPWSPTQATMVVPPTRDTTSAKESVATTEVPLIRDTIGDREPLIVLATVALPHTRDATGDSEAPVVLTSTDALATKEAPRGSMYFTCGSTVMAVHKLHSVNSNALRCSSHNHRATFTDM
ncbi:hypothetical protein ISCGN_025207 [Ixodes scapularis]